MALLWVALPAAMSAMSWVTSFFVAAKGDAAGQGLTGRVRSGARFRVFWFGPWEAECLGVRAAASPDLGVGLRVPFGELPQCRGGLILGRRAVVGETPDELQPGAVLVPQPGGKARPVREGDRGRVLVVEVGADPADLAVPPGEETGLFAQPRGYQPG